MGLANVLWTVTMVYPITISFKPIFIKDIDIHEIIKPDSCYVGDEELIQRIHQNVIEYGVVIIPSQTITHNQLTTFTSRFGEIIPLKLKEKIVTNIDMQTNVVTDNYHNAESWHSDGYYAAHDHIYNFLYGEEIPNIGGNTGFVDKRLFYDHLKNNNKSLFSYLKDKQVKICCNNQQSKENIYRTIIHKHSVTNRHVIRFGSERAEIKGLNQDESNVLLKKLVKIIEDDSNSFLRFEHIWTVGDIVIWDNTAVMHRAMGNIGNGERRKLIRTQARFDATALRTYYSINGHDS
eukprot:298414_1